MDYRKVSVGQGWQWYVEGWRLFATRPGVIYLVLLLFLLVQFVISMVPLIGAPIATLIGPALLGGVYLVFRRIRGVRADMQVDALAREQNISAGMLFEGLKDPERRRRFLILGALGLLFNFVLLLVLMGSLSLPDDPEQMATMDEEQVMLALLNIPLGVWLMVFSLWTLYMAAMTFAIPLVAMRGVSAMTAIKASLAAIAANILPCLVYGLVGLALMFLAILPMGLGLILLIPVLFASVFAAFEDIFAEPAASGGQEDPLWVNDGEQSVGKSGAEPSRDTQWPTPPAGESGDRKGPGRVEM